MRNFYKLERGLENDRKTFEKSFFIVFFFIQLVNGYLRTCLLDNLGETTALAFPVSGELLRANLGPIYTIRFCRMRQAHDRAMTSTYDCRSVLKHVLKCYDIFSDVHNNRKSCRGPVV